MKRILRTVNLTLLFAVPLLTGVLLGVTYHQAKATTPGHCPTTECSIPPPGDCLCPNGQTLRSEFAGDSCGLSVPDGCCQYQDFNIYCNGVYKAFALVLYDNYPSVLCAEGGKCPGYSGP